MNFTEFILLFKSHNTWADNSELNYLPPIPIQWKFNQKVGRHINSKPLHNKINATLPTTQYKFNQKVNRPINSKPLGYKKS